MLRRRKKKEKSNNSKYDQKPEKEQAMGIAEVTELVEKFVLANTAKKPAAAAAKVFFTLSFTSSPLVLSFPLFSFYLALC